MLRTGRAYSSSEVSFEDETTTSTSVSLAAPGNVIIVGGTVAAMLYAGRILSNRSNVTVNILVEGNNKLNDPEVALAGFGERAVREKNSLFYREDPLSFVFEEQPTRNTTITLPRGLAAEAIYTYPSVVEYPPILVSGINSAAAQLVQAITEERRSTNSERIMNDKIHQAFDIPVDNDIVSEGPVILGRHYSFEICNAARSEREVGMRIYRKLTTEYGDRCNFYFGCKNIRFVRPDPSPADDRVYVTRFYAKRGRVQVDFQLTGRLYLKGTIYDNIRVATEGGLTSLRGLVNTYRVPGGYAPSASPSLSTYIPACYRGRYVIPLNNQNELGQRFNFTLPTIRTSSPACDDKAWVIQAFVTDFDARDRDYAISGSAILVIEGLSYLNRRVLYWNNSTDSRFILLANTNPEEKKFFNEFRSICRTMLYEFGVVDFPVGTLTRADDTGFAIDDRHISPVITYMSNTMILINECLALFEPNLLS